MKSGNGTLHGMKSGNGTLHVHSYLIIINSSLCCSHTYMITTQCFEGRVIQEQIAIGPYSLFLSLSLSLCCYGFSRHQVIPWQTTPLDIKDLSKQVPDCHTIT